MNPRPNPYVGPRAFQPGEPFYGRDRELRSLSALLIAERIVLLHSPSGSGKTSLIQAGLLPRLHEENFNLLPIVRVNTEPPEGVASITGFNRYALSTMLSLEEGLAEDQRTPVSDLSALTLDEYLDKRPRAAEASVSDVLIFDQFEEVLTIAPTDRESKQAFFEQLGKALRNKDRWALVAIREDYLGALAPYTRPIPGRFAATFRLDLLGVEGALQAIQRPAKAQNVDFMVSAAQKLVDDLRRIQVQLPDGSLEEQLGPHIEPVQLQVVCYRLWQGLSETEMRIDESHLAGVGDVNQSLADYYSASVKAIAEKSAASERVIREWFDRKLITPEGIRGQVLMGAESSEGLPNAVVGNLEDAHIIRGEKRAGKTWYELSHDRMIKPVREDNTTWFSANLSLFQQQAVLWAQQGRSEGLLLRGKPLEQAEKEAKTLPLNADEQAFLAACRKLREQERRERLRNRIILGLAVGAMLAMIVAVIFGIRASAAQKQAQESLVKAQQAEATAVVARDQAQQAQAEAVKQRDLADLNSKMAFVRELTAKVLTSLESDPERSILLALQAIQIDQAASQPIPPDTEEALRQAIQTSRLRHLISNSSGASLNAVAFSPDGRLVATGGWDGSVQLWKVWESPNPSFGSGVNVGTLWVEKALDVPTVDGPTLSVAFSPDSNLLAFTSSADIIIWDTVQGKKLFSLSGHTGVINKVVFSPDGKLLASASDDGTVRLWEIASGKQASTLALKQLDNQPGLTDDIQPKAFKSVAFSPNGKLLASARDDFQIYVSDAQTGATLYTIQTINNDWNSDVIFSPDGKLLVWGDHEGYVAAWDLAAQKKLFEVRNHKFLVGNIAFSPDGTLLASAGYDQKVVVLDAHTGSTKFTLSGDTNEIHAVAFSPNGKYIVSVNAGGETKFWDALPSAIPEAGSIAAQTQPITGLAFSPFGKLIATSANESEAPAANIWPITDGLPTKLNAGGTFDIAFSPDGTLLASAGFGKASIWDKTLGSETSTINIDASDVFETVAFSPDGKYLAGGLNSDKAVVWDRKTGQKKFEVPFDQPGLFVWAVAFSPDGKLFAAGCDTWQIKIVDIATGKTLRTLEHKNWVRSVAFSPDSKRLLSGSYDNTAVVWDVVTGEKIFTLSGHTGGLNDAKFSPDGTRIATASQDGTVKVWDAGNGNLLFTLSPSAGAVARVAFSPDGKILATGSEDGVVRFYYLNLEDVLALARVRITRPLTDEECKAYLHATTACPTDTLIMPEKQPEKPANALPLQPVPIEKKPLRSGNGTVQVTLEIVNHSSETLKLYWVDSNGNEQPYGDLAPSSTTTQGTNSTDAWRVKDAAGNVILEYVATEQSTQKIEIKPDKTVVTPVP